MRKKQCKSSQIIEENKNKMAEMLVLHRSIFVHMLENIAPTATIEDVEKVQELVASIDEVLGDE
ncbi:hypothetical protein VPHK394_0050 [Vibrio phage K394]